MRQYLYHWKKKTHRLCSINILDNKIELYSTQHDTIDDICVSTSVRELCESPDSEYTNFFDRNVLYTT